MIAEDENLDISYFATHGDDVDVEIKSYTQAFKLIDKLTYYGF